jgi:hypothetical protein
MSDEKLINYDCPICGQQMIILTDSFGFNYQCPNPECVICETLDYFRPQTIESLSRKMAGLVLDKDSSRVSTLAEVEKMIEERRNDDKNNHSPLEIVRRNEDDAILSLIRAIKEGGKDDEC